MSLDNVQLNPLLTESMYKHYLIDVHAQKDVQKEKSEAPVKKTLILTDRTAADIRDSDDFLNAILKACKLNDREIEIRNAGEGESTEAETFIQSKAFENILIFGAVSVGSSPENNQQDVVIQKTGATTIVQSPSLAVLQREKAMKMKLWKHLQALFDIS